MMLYFFILGTLSLVVTESGSGKRHELGVVCDTLPTQRPLHLAVGKDIPAVDDLAGSSEVRIADFKLLA